MPETEGRSLEDIEFHFTNNSKTLCDRHIAYVQSKQDNPDEFQCTSGDTNDPADNNVRKHVINGSNADAQQLKCNSMNAHENCGFVSDI